MNSERINLEHKLFSKLSQEWWDENGKFKVLHQIRPIRIEYILKQINSKKIKNLDVLDLGCGGGLVSESLARLNANVTGVDFVKNNIEVAKKHALKKKLKINYIQDDIEKLKLSKKFDIIIMFEILEHLNDWSSFLVKIKKNLNKNGMIKAVKTIKINGTSRILLKGGHLNEIDLCDILYDNNNFFEFYSKKIDTNNTHGTGCTISSAITANLSKGLSLYESVSIAHEYVRKSILNAPNLGSGHGPLNHFHLIPD